MKSMCQYETKAARARMEKWIKNGKSTAFNAKRTIIRLGVAERDWYFTCGQCSGARSANTHEHPSNICG